MKKNFGMLALCLGLVFSARAVEAQRVGVLTEIGARSDGRAEAVADSIPIHSLTPRDTFLGPDKVKHFLLSAFIESVGFSGMQLVGSGRGVSLAAATAVTAAAGVVREIHDGRTKGLFSLGDLTWDALGAGAAILLVSHAQR